MIVPKYNDVKFLKWKMKFCSENAICIPRDWVSLLVDHTFIQASLKISCMHYTGQQFFSQKSPLFGFWLISTNFGLLIPNLKSVFGCLVRILQCCKFYVFRARKSNFQNLQKYVTNFGARKHKTGKILKR